MKETNAYLILHGDAYTPRTIGAVRRLLREHNVKHKKLVSVAYTGFMVEPGRGLTKVLFEITRLKNHHHIEFNEEPAPKK